MFKRMRANKNLYDYIPGYCGAFRTGLLLSLLIALTALPEMTSHRIFTVYFSSSDFKRNMLHSYMKDSTLIKTSGSSKLLTVDGKI